MSITPAVVAQNYTDFVSATLNYVSVPDQNVSQNVTIFNQASYAMVANPQQSLFQSNGTLSFQFPSGINRMTGATGTGNCYAPGTLSQDQTLSATFSYTYNPSISGQKGLSVTATVTCNMKGAAVIAPNYEVVSILYDPPGDASSNGYAYGTTGGVTSSVSNNFGASVGITFKETDKLAGGFSLTNGVSQTWGLTSGNSTAFSATINSTEGSQLKSAEQSIDHTQDQIYVLLNPAMYFYQTGSSTAVYTPSFLNETTYGDVLNSNVVAFQNPTQMGLAYLEPQNTGEGTYPGFSNICAHPLPPSQCTASNACGCVASDFATIVAQDPMVGAGQTLAPTSVDANRFVSLNEPIKLEGPQQQGSGPVQITYALSDSNLQSSTASQTQNYSVGFISGYGWNSPKMLGFGSGFSITNTNTFTWAQTQSQGTFNGTSHTASTVLGSSKVGCLEYADVYEDTVYHTFLFALSTNPPAACQ